MVKLKYHANNSGGNWWLSGEDWFKLEGAGWNVEWSPLLGSEAQYAEKEFESVKEGLVEFQKIINQEIAEQGCPCCGPPHTFEWEENGAKMTLQGRELAKYLFEDV